MGEPGFMVPAYTDIGHAVVSWSHLEQTIITLTWKSRDPHHLSPFRQGSIEPGFYKRWLEWCRIFTPSDDLKSLVIELSMFRDDLCHNIVEIEEAHKGYSLAIFRRHRDWRGSWERWAEKYLRLHWRARPPAPKDQEYLRYENRHLAKFVAAVIKAESEITAIGDAWLLARRAG